TAAYADLARAAGSPNAGRAVGSAMANNPLPLIVPCHRVVRSDGTIGGFSSPQGLVLKRRLLRLEGAPPV
ncbi:MAG: methylated-DNA--[protein]-cysteine S-methyltransferase, partial [Planctomycetota bacterium]